MKTSGATKAAVRTVEPLTDYATHNRKTSTRFTGHVGSTDPYMTNGDRTLGHSSNQTASQTDYSNPLTQNTKNPVNPLMQLMGVTLGVYPLR